MKIYMCENKFKPCVCIALFYGFYSPHNLLLTSVTRKKSTNVYKSYPKTISLENF